jgi:two-component system LytT family response regulator
MSAFRVLTVDNNASERRQLRDLLSLDPECELIAECSDGAEAIRSLDHTQPHIVFVDAQTPETDGLEVARAISGRPPLVILTSRCSGYAIRAFEAHVFDYLLKPLEQSRFLESLGRAKAEIASIVLRGHRVLESLERMLRPKRIAVRRNGRVLFIALDQIDWIEAADNYVCLHCGGETHMLRQTMSEVEASLDPSRFVRVHRSAIVNLDRIKELRPWFRGDYRVILHDGTMLTLTKTHRERLDAQLLLGSFTR